MSKIIFCLAVLLCLAVQANAQATFTTYTYTASNDCTGVNTNTSTVITKCNYNSADGTSSSTFVNSDATRLYAVRYSDANCTTASATSAGEALVPTAYSGACQAFGASFSIKSVIANPSQGPAFPISPFPPSGWAVSTSYVNTTTQRNIDTCSAGTGVVTLTSATKPGVCSKHIVPGTSNVKGSQAGYCSADGTFAGTATFTDDACTGSSLVRASVRNTGCNNGVSLSCSGVSSTFPSSLPNIGIIQYDNSACTVNPKNAPSVSLFATGATTANPTCFDSNTFTCQSTNNGTTATYTTFSDSTGQGLCTTQVYQNTQVAASTVCNSNQQVYTCQFVPGGLSAASSVSVSAIAMIVAAFVALVASRSL